jgi:iron complex outermembrane receptor protein
VVYEGDSGSLAGKRPTEIPAQYFSVYGDYTFADGALDGLGAGVGVRHNGNTLADQTSEFTTSPYTLVDFQMHYDLGKAVPSFHGTTLQVTAQNLFDTYYVASCYSASFGCFIGAGRNVIGRLTYKW